jgi:hypothetical protein
MLLHTTHGVAILKDWHYEDRISRAYRNKPPKQGEGMDLMQALILKKPAAELPPPVPVPVLDNVEKLARFFHNH